jgi:abequosyltransferase
MSLEDDVQREPLLSICMATYKRGRFIGQTLESILPQLVPEVELVIVDGASPDETESVVKQYIRRHPAIRYVREVVNSGIDRDYDKAVSYARGRYCWLMTDDDLVRPGAIGRLLEALKRGHDLVVLNSEVMNVDFSSTIVPRFIHVENDRVYVPQDADALFTDAGHALTFIGCVVIRRQLWQERSREPYFGSLFIHVGVIFQQPLLGTAMIVSEPVITIRYGNAMWTPRTFEVWMFLWPKLVWSFEWLSSASRSSITLREPWRKLRKLMIYRGMGAYGMAEFDNFLSQRTRGLPALASRLVAMVPERLMNAVAGLYCLLLARKARANIYDLSRSHSATYFSRLAAATVGLIKRP